MYPPKTGVDENGKSYSSTVFFIKILTRFPLKKSSNNILKQVK